jgi:DNA invertase Pin-like site-specific DNA recombinase
VTNSKIDSSAKIRPEHLERKAYVYVRQSSLGQVRDHVEGRLRQYQMVDWAEQAGWPKERIVVIDEDQGKSASVAESRAGFGGLVTAAGRGEAGIVISLEVSRLARNSPDWHNLIYLSRWTDTLITDGQTIYDPKVSADRMVLGIRGQVSELELDHSIQRMIEARWNKARRGELMTIPPAGYDLDDLNQLVLTTDESVSHAIQTVFAKLDELGSGRQVFLWWKQQQLTYPVRRVQLRSHPVVWLEPKYAMVLRTLHNPIYAGVYVFGRFETVRELDHDNPNRLRVRRVQRRNPWPVLIEDHHPAYISFEKYLKNQELLGNNAMMKARDANKAGPVREGEALLQGLVRCGRCGRAMSVGYGGHRPGCDTRTMQYRCKESRTRLGGKDCQTIGGKRIDEAVMQAFLEATTPAGLEAVGQMQEQLQADNETLERSWALQVEKADYEAKRAERQFHAAEPENRLVARELERRWNERLKELEVVREKAAAARRRIPWLSEEEMDQARQLAHNLEELWHSKTTTNRDRKRLLRCLIEEVQLTTEDKRYLVRIVWKGGALTEREVVRRPSGGGFTKTPEDTIELVGKLAREFDDTQIARILNKQGRRTGIGNPFTQAIVLSLRGHHKIPKCLSQQARDPKEGPFTADEAAAELGVGMGTIHRWLRQGVLAGVQATPGAPWRILLTEEVRRRLSGGDAPAGWVSLGEAARRLGLSKSHVTYLAKTGRLEAMQTTVRQQRRWRINVDEANCGRQAEMFERKTDIDAGEK